MAFSDPLKFRGVTHINREGVSSQIAHGLKAWLDWGMLSIGAFQNVKLSQATTFGGDKSRLRPAKDHQYADGRVWEGFRADWVYETGVPFAVTPVSISGVWVNGSLTRVGAGCHVDYPNGRIVLDTAVAQTATVRAEFTYRTVNIVDAEEPFFKELLFEGYRVDRSDYLHAESGKWAQHPHNRLSLPAIGVEMVPNRKSEPYELGEARKQRQQDVLFYVVSDNPQDKRNLTDLLDAQDDKTIWLPNQNSIKENTDWALDYRGMTVSGFKTYPQYVAPTGVGGYQWRTLQFSNTRAQSLEMVDPMLYGAVIRTTTNVLA